MVTVDLAKFVEEEEGEKEYSLEKTPLKQGTVRIRI